MVSLAVTTKVAELCEVGVPVIRPPELIDNPAGRLPLASENV